MDKLIELCEFLAWVQDNYSEIWDDKINDYKLLAEANNQHYTRDQVVTHYLAERGIKDA